MKKLTSAILAISMLAVCLPAASTASAALSVSDSKQTQGAKHHLNLRLNLSEQALDWMNRDSILKGNTRVFNEKLLDKKVPGNLELTFETRPGQLPDYDEIAGQGMFRVGNVTGTVNLKDDIQKFTAYNGDTVYSSPVEATFKFGKETYNGLVMLTYKPSTNSALVSLSIGEISDQGTGMVFFGEPFMEMHDVNEQMHKQLKGNPLNTEQQQPEQFEESNNHATAIAPEATSVFHYRGSVDNKYLRFQNESSAGYVGKGVVGINVYDRDPSVNGQGKGAVQVRAWSNNLAVINYANAKDPYHYTTTSYVYEGYLSLNTNNNMIHIANAGPVDGVQIEKWDFLANVPLIGNALDFLANAYVAMQNNNIKVTSTKTQAGTGLTTYWRKNIKTLGESADFPYVSDTAYDRRGNKDRGVNAYFFYDEYVDGTQTLTAGARMDYMVNTGNLYYGVFYSDAAVVNWTGNF